MSDQPSPDPADFQQSTVQLYPPWREAVKRFQEYEFRPGDTITHEWLFEALGISLPKPDEKLSRKEFDAINLRFLGQFKAFRDTLLDEMQVDIVSKQGVGYEVVEPHEQAEKAFEDGIKELRKAMRKMSRRVVNVDYNKLTQEQRQEHARQLEKLGLFKGMIRKSRRALLLPVRKNEDD